jgi:integration host factor subunit beta
MKKSDLIKEIHKLYPFLTNAQATDAVNIVFASISNGLQNKERVEIRGLGSFVSRKRKVQAKFSTQTNEKSLVERESVYFRMGKELFDRLNEKES